MFWGPGKERLCLRARGAVPPPRAAPGARTTHTRQNTHQAAVGAALTYVQQLLQNGEAVTLEVGSNTTELELRKAPVPKTSTKQQQPKPHQGTGESGGLDSSQSHESRGKRKAEEDPPTQNKRPKAGATTPPPGEKRKRSDGAEGRAPHAKRQRLQKDRNADRSKQAKRQREGDQSDDSDVRAHSVHQRRKRLRHFAQTLANRQKIESLARLFPGRITVSAPLAATPLEMTMQAQEAAQLPDVNAHVTLATGQTRSASQWDESRTWDPGD